MQNDLTKTMPVLICAETCQKDMFLRKYIFGVWPGGMRVALGINMYIHIYIIYMYNKSPRPRVALDWVGVGLDIQKHSG